MKLFSLRTIAATSALLIGSTVLGQATSIVLTQRTFKTASPQEQVYIKAIAGITCIKERTALNDDGGEWMKTGLLKSRDISYAAQTTFELDEWLNEEGARYASDSNCDIIMNHVQSKISLDEFNNGMETVNSFGAECGSISDLNLDEQDECWPEAALETLRRGTGFVAEDGNAA